ncbi:MAG: peroxiredoxin [Candidatus Neomarinimicrobiota bacterium]|nr:peroxiredoxin [Candidatus Neomarinimicrobiota bacterium]
MSRLISKISILSIIMISCNLFSDEVHLNEGQIAPDFTLFDQDGTPHTLSLYKGKKVVIYFYPKDDTPGCTKEACSIRDSYDDFTNQDIEVFGISYDNSETHQQFIQKYKLPFNLLSDSDKLVSQLYGTKGAFFPVRKTFLIDEFGKIVKIYDQVSVLDHGNDILRDFNTEEN